MVSPLAATQAYAAVQKIAADPAAAAESQASSGPSFAEMVNNVIGQTIQTSRNAEAQMMGHAKGQADLLDVVTAVSSAQTSLQTVMAVRDQVISAYKEILSLQI
jgi:flagellar hook-basal body complex protein FliE